MKLYTKLLGMFAFCLTLSGWCAYGATVHVEGTLNMWFKVVSIMIGIFAGVFLIIYSHIINN